MSRAAMARRTQHYVPRAAASLPSSFNEQHCQAEETTTSKSAPAAFGRNRNFPGNLERFLESTTPSVPAQHFSKTTRDWRTCDEECRTYFNLEDLWESFKEWSAYGAGVPIVLNGEDTVVQYYVPYLSGIQLYVDSGALSLGPSDVDSFRDTSSDGSSDSEMENGSKFSWNRVSSRDMVALDKLFLDDKLRDLHDEFFSDDSDFGDSQGSLIFEYYETDRPFYREPLANKILGLAKKFPVLKTTKSCYLHPTSWFSVAWYPIYRIPTGPTMLDLEASFLTFHFLSTPMKGTANRPIITKQEIYLPVFGLASLKCKGTLWASNGEDNGKLANTLLQTADKWLQLLKTNHPDFRFFVSRMRS